MKSIKKLFAMGLALMMALSIPFSVSAAELEDAPIDESRTGSLTIYKYDLTNAEKDGVWDSSYVSTGVFDQTGVNDVLGGSSLDSPVTVVAASSCEVLLFPYERLLLSDGSAAHQQALQNLVRTVSDKYFLLSRRVDLLLLKSLRAKVCAYLLSEAEAHHSLTFTVPYSRIRLADYLNCDRSALSRELSLMQRDGLLETYKSSFKLLEPDALRHMVL